MINSRNYKFKINVSAEAYTSKIEARACLTNEGAKSLGRSKMAFKEQWLTVDEFLEKATSGYCFCNIFEFDPDSKYQIENNWKAYPVYRTGEYSGYMKLSFKRDEYFKESYVVFVDIDYTKFRKVESFVEKLTFKPTGVYMSYSDGVEKNGITSRRFHLAYVFDSPLGKEDFTKVSRILTKQIEEDTGEIIEDYCGTRLSQYMNGCYGNNKTIRTYAIYSPIDILGVGDKFSIPLILAKEEPKISFNEQVLFDYDNYSEEEFKKKPSWIECLQNYSYIWRIAGPTWINDSYQLASPNYFRLFFYPKKVEDGDKRRRKLYERMCLRRVMKPDITSEELQFNTIMDVLKFFDNSDGVLDSEFIKKNITNCFKYSIEELTEYYSTEIEYLRKIFFPKKGFIYKTKLHHTREITWCILDEMFDRNLSIKENLEAINNFGFPISMRTLYDYVNSRGITNLGKIKDEEELISLLDFNLSGDENYRRLKEKGYKVDNRKIHNILNKYK